MPIAFIMPKMDMDQEEVVIDQWLKQEGDPIEKGEPVIIVETDKITSEIEAPASGILAGVLYQVNDRVPVTQIVAYILEEGETEADLPNTEKAVQAPPQEDLQAITPILDKPISATALAKRVAATEGIDLGDVPTTGDKITKEDVDAYIETRRKIIPRVETPATPAARRLASEHKVDITAVKGTGPRHRVQASDVVSALQQESFRSPDYPSTASTLVPLELTSMRRRIAERLTASYQNIPHIFLTVEVDMSRAEKFRQQLNRLASENGQPKISITTYLVKVVSDCLTRHPFLNAYLEGDKINFWKDVNIGIAAALEDGLIVPVIHKANSLSINEINLQVRTLSQKTQDGKLTLEEIQGGTFTISNLGMYGINSFTSIINPPQSAILSVGSITRRIVVVDDEDSINVRPMMNLTLAADHRIVDGAIAAHFLVDLKNSLETPEYRIDLV